MKQTRTIEDLCEYLWALEAQYSLLDYTLSGVRVWQARRINIYYHLAQNLGLYSQPNKPFTKLNKIKSSFQMLCSSIVSNPLFLPKSDCLIVTHPRVKKIAGVGFEDIYTYYLSEKLKNDGVSVSILEQHQNGEHFSHAMPNKKYSDFITLYSKFCRMIDFNRKLSNPNDFLKLIELNIYKDLGVKIDLYKEFDSYSKQFNSIYKVFGAVLDKASPSVLYIVVSYDMSPYIKAAKERGIKVVELQHGTLGKYHLGYSFPRGIPSLDYFPDELYVWSKYWKVQADLALFPVATKVYGFDYLESEKARITDKNKVSNSVILISQGALTKKIASFLLNNFDLFSGLDFIYKLHPAEYGRWRECQELVALSNMPNIEVIEDCDLYQKFSNSEYVVGVFSTAIFEAVEFGCKPMLLDLPGIEYMSDFIEYHNLSLNNGVYSYDSGSDSAVFE